MENDSYLDVGYLPYTQDVSDDLDVVWEWNSPSTKCKEPTKKAVVCVEESPRRVVKRCPSNKDPQVSHKLKKDLEVLKMQVRDNLNQMVEFENFDDDSFDEQLLLCSQRAENEYSRSNSSNRSLIKAKSDITLEVRSNNLDSMLFNDSFDSAVQKFSDDHLQSLCQVSNERVNIDPPNINKVNVKNSNTCTNTTSASVITCMNAHNKPAVPREVVSSALTKGKVNITFELDILRY